MEVTTTVRENEKGELDKREDKEDESVEAN